ncbi:hypothetical protein MPTA5024_15100 [Microbispora sp. ATCC PTA-5024]|nr:hypothetical protein MPTA5024_15100 [Microbispora sp. ATCC PTA-5024]
MAVAGALAAGAPDTAGRVARSSTTGAPAGPTRDAMSAKDTAAPRKPAPAPSPRTYSGVSAKVVKLRRSDWTGVWLVTLTHRGESNFIVSPLDAHGAEQGSIVNEIGGYKGTVLLNEDEGAQTAALKIQADGAWTVTLKPLSMARRWTGAGLTGHGDDVAIVSRPSSGLTTVTARHSGSANFIVDAYTESSRENLVNEIGGWHGEVPLPDGTVLLTVHADGVWSFAKS